MVAKYLTEKRVSGTFEKTIGSILSYLAFILTGSVSWPLYIFVFLAPFSALWWPNIWPKIWFPEFFEKTVGSINFISGIYPYGVTLYIFVFLASFFGRLVAKYFWQFFHITQTFYTNCCDAFNTMTLLLAKWCLNYSRTKFSSRIPTCVAHDCKIEIFIGYIWMRWVMIRAGVYCPHLRAQLVWKWISDINLYCTK